MRRGDWSLSGVEFCEDHGRPKLGRAWQDRSTTAYWDIVTCFSESERDDVLPEGSVSMDGGGHYPHAAVEQTASGSVGFMESGNGAGALVCLVGRQPVLSTGLGP
jgi:hypothetical protein